MHKTETMRTALIAWLLPLFLFTGSLFAQHSTQADKDLSSPQATVVTHLTNLQVDNYKPHEASKVFFGLDRKQSEQLAIKLKMVMDAKGLYVDTADIPRLNTIVDSSGEQRKFQLFLSEPDIFLVKVGDNWYYSKRTAEMIPQMYEDIFPWGSDLLIEYTGSIGQKALFNLWIWQWIGIVLLIAAAYLLYWILKFLIEFIIGRVAKTQLKRMIPNMDLIHKIARQLSFFLLARFLILALPIIHLPVKLNSVVVFNLRLISVIFIIILAMRLIDYLIYYLSKLAEKTESTMDDQLIPSLRTILKVIVVIMGIFYLLRILNVDIAPLIAGISIGGIAIALAAQDSVKNFFGSILIFVDKPFQIGDWIVFDGASGTIEEVGLRSTRIRTFANSLVYVPNGILADKVIDNMGLRVYRRFTTDVGVTYDTPPELIEAFVEGIKKLVAVHPTTRKDYYEVHLNSFGPSSLNIMVYIFFDVPDWTGELKGRHEIMLGIIKLASKLGVEFAFPTQTLHIQNLPGQNSLDPKYVVDEASVQKAVDSYVEEFKASGKKP